MCWCCVSVSPARSCPCAVIPGLTAKVMEQAQTMADVYSAYHDFAFVMMKKVRGVTIGHIILDSCMRECVHLLP